MVIAHKEMTVMTRIFGNCASLLLECCALIASKIGHDVAFTNYAVDRTPRQAQAQTVETAQPSVSVPMIQQGPTNQVDASFRANEPAPVSM